MPIRQSANTGVVRDVFYQIPFSHSSAKCPDNLGVNGTAPLTSAWSSRGDLIGDRAPDYLVDQCITAIYFNPFSSSRHRTKLPLTYDYYAGAGSAAIWVNAALRQLTKRTSLVSKLF